MAIVPRKKIVTPENVAGVIEDAPQPFVTAIEIAEALGVTAQAVRNNESELIASDEIEGGEVGRSTVYWLAAGRLSPEQETEEPPESSEQSQRSKKQNSGSSKGIIDRLFAGVPSFGSPTEVWTLTALTALLGLTLGVAIGLLVARPPVGVAVLVVSLLLAAALTVTLPVAVYQTFAHRRKAGVETA